MISVSCDSAAAASHPRARCLARISNEWKPGTLAEGALTSHDCCSSAVLPPAPAPPLPPAFPRRPDPLLPLAPAAGSPSAAVVLPPAVAFTVPLVVPFEAADGGGGGGFGCVRRVQECQLQAQGHVTNRRNEPCGNKVVLR